MIEKEYKQFWFSAGISFKSFGLGFRINRYGVDVELYPFFFSVEFPLPRETMKRILERIEDIESGKEKTILLEDAIKALS